MTGPGWRAARERLQRSLRAIANAVGCSAPHLSDIEHGRRKPSRNLEIRLRAALKLPPPEPLPPGPFCVVCGTALDELSVEVPTLHDPNGVIGPGYAPLRRGFSRPDGLGCPKCGLRYHKAPELNR